MFLYAIKNRPKTPKQTTIQRKTWSRELSIKRYVHLFTLVMTFWKTVEHAVCRRPLTTLLTKVDCRPYLYDFIFLL